MCFLIHCVPQSVRARGTEKLLQHMKKGQ